MLTHKGTKKLKTDRLLLRRFELSDAEDMFKNWATNPNVTRFLTWQPHGSIEVTRGILTEWVYSYAKPDFYQWAIVLDEIDEPIGSLSVVRINEAVDEVEIGYCIGEKWWRQGYTSEAFSRVIEYLFDEVGAKRICAKHDTQNPNSGRVMVKCGLEYEGTLRRAGKNSTNECCDLAIYSIIK